MDTLRDAVARGQILTAFRAQITQPSGKNLKVDQDTFKTSRTEDGNYKFDFSATRYETVNQITRAVGEESFSGIYNPATKTVQFDTVDEPTLPAPEPTEPKALFQEFMDLLDAFSAKLKALFGSDRIDG